MTDDKALWDSYNKLSGVANISIFKSGRKKYFLYCDKGFSEQVLKDSLKYFRNSLTAIENRIEIVDLNSFCSTRESIVEGHDIKFKKTDVTLPCYTCN